MLWSSPEQMSGKSVGKPSDIFNLGMLFCYAWSGRHPFEAPKSDAMMFRLMNSEPNLEGVPARLHQMILSCLKKEPSERPSVAQLRGLMGNISRSGSGSNSGSMGAGASSQPTGTVLVDMERHMESRRVGKSDTPTTRLTNPKFLAGIAVAVVLVISGIAIFGRGSSSSEDLIPQDSSSVVPTLAGEDTANLKSLSDFRELPMDPQRSATTAANRLSIDVKDKRHTKNGTDGVYDLKWMRKICKPKDLDPITVQLGLNESAPSHFTESLNLVIQHVSEILQASPHPLKLKAPETTFSGETLDPIISSIGSNAEAKDRNQNLYAQFGSPDTGTLEEPYLPIRPLRIILSPSTSLELETIYQKSVMTSRAKEGWSISGAKWPSGYFVDYGWSIATSRTTGWQGPKAIDASIVTIAREIWDSSEDEALLLVFARALMIGLGASDNQETASLLLNSGGQFAKNTYSYTEADMRLIKSLGYEDLASC
jgi:hypothetical protein